ncbi:MAG: GTP-binding protein, partial [Cyanobacteria bacterium J06648_11]
CMSDSSIVVVAGPSGSGKTAWIVQCLTEATQPALYVSVDGEAISVELAYIGYRFPKVRLANASGLPQVLKALSEPTAVYVEVGFAEDVRALDLGGLPCRRVAILPPSLHHSVWHDWADEIVLGNDVAIFEPDKMPEVWTMSLTGQVFDAPSLDEITIELTGGAYGKVHRMKALVELPDGRLFHLDFVDGMPGIEYGEPRVPQWLEGRPQRFSGIEVVGWNLEGDTIARTIGDGCLSTEAIAHYQLQYKSQRSSSVPQAAL